MRKRNITTDMMKSYITESLFLLMEKKLYSAISIGEITQKARVNRSTYYRNFSSKEDILRFFLDGLMKHLISYRNNIGLPTTLEASTIV